MARRKKTYWRLPFRRPTSWPIVDEGVREEYPALGGRFERAEELIEPDFEEFDLKALGAQERHRRYRLALILLSGLTAVFGAVQSGFPDARWPGIAVALASVLATRVAVLQKTSGALNDYLRSRSKAEHLRSLYFRSLFDLDGGHRRPVERAVADAIYLESEQTSK